MACRQGSRSPNTGPRPFLGHYEGPPVRCSVPLGPKFCSASLQDAGKILCPPNTGPRLFFQEALGAPASMLLRTSGPEISACQQVWRGQNTGPGLFFLYAMGAPASALLHASWPQILFCQVVGRGPDSRFLPNTGSRPDFGAPPACCFASWPQILVCQHARRRPTVMTFYPYYGNRSQHSEMPRLIPVRVLHISGPERARCSFVVIFTDYQCIHYYTCM